MKKLPILLILTYLLFAINSRALSQNLNNNDVDNKKALKIGVLLPLSGEFKSIGEAFLKSIQLGLYDIGNKNIKIYLKDSKANALTTYQSAKEFEKLGVKIVIGPIFYNSLERLSEINNITFISLTNKTEGIPSNTIAFGINIDSQIDAITQYFKKNEISKTLLLSPKSKFTEEFKTIQNSDLNFYKTFLYDTSPKKITGEIEKITKYHERKKDLERRIIILEKSKLYKDKQELKKLEQKHTIGKVNFDSVMVVDFGERLKSVLTSFSFTDVSTDQVDFFTVNQWFDKSFFNELALQNLHFPSINFDNLDKFNKKFFNKFNEEPNEVSILAYDALGLIYYCWFNNDFEFKKDQLYNKSGFKGLQGKFSIKGNHTKQNLKIYKVTKNKFVQVN
jgi:ABC-type branched-subunit amino acid transport system substrate-binding protein|tara:strand:+ start:504 stop:1679 length:1176 start_codon:yes stop_codon:yes gene_type:complete